MTAGRVIALAGLVAGTAAVLAAGFSAEARSHFGGKRGGPDEWQAEGQPETDPEARMVIRPSGLVPVFSRDADCPDIASPFGSSTRFDGSRRPASRHGGLHGGIDITLPEGTPLRALAAGRVIGTGTGGIAVGIYLWLQHSPQDTGLPFWVYSKYQHFREEPRLRVGETLAVGQVVGLSGKTGTIGRHYGLGGYPHLHLTTFAGPGDRYEVRDSAVIVPGSRIVDPLAIYLPGLRDADEIERLPKERRKVAIPYVARDGAAHPAGTRVIWPVACK